MLPIGDTNSHYLRKMKKRLPILWNVLKKTQLIKKSSILLIRGHIAHYKCMIVAYVSIFVLIMGAVFWIGIMVSEGSPLLCFHCPDWIWQ